MKIELESITENPEMSIAKAGGISHDNEIDNIEAARKLNRKFIDRGHCSPVEFSSATFYVEDISRVFLAQLSRHRHINLMVKSFRYNQPDNGLVIPDSIKDWANKTIENQDALDRTVESANWFYDQLIEGGVPKEDARFFKPMGERTKLYVRFNFREARHIIKLRGLNEHAQWEIREFAQEVLECLHNKAPSIFEDLVEEYEE